jgi:transglutaminase-like putative cysteine protease
VVQGRFEEYAIEYRAVFTPPPQPPRADPYANVQFLMALPPRLDGQELVSATLAVEGREKVAAVPLLEKGPLRRTVLSLVLPLNEEASFTARMSLRIRLAHRYLREGRRRATSDPAASLYLPETPTLNWKSPAFQEWLDRQQARPAQGEPEMDFMYRAFAIGQQCLTYVYRADEKDRIVSRLIAQGTTDCGGGNAVYAAACRAAGFPTRLCVGYRLAPERGMPYHVTSESYSEEAGWFPVDATPPAASATKARNFGVWSTPHVTMHLDPDLTVETLAGPQRLAFLQSIQASFMSQRGTWHSLVIGKDEKWSVRRM